MWYTRTTLPAASPAKSKRDVVSFIIAVFPGCLSIQYQFGDFGFMFYETYLCKNISPASLLYLWDLLIYYYPIMPGFTSFPQFDSSIMILCFWYIPGKYQWTRLIFEGRSITAVLSVFAVCFSLFSSGCPADLGLIWKINFLLSSSSSLVGFTQRVGGIGWWVASSCAWDFLFLQLCEPVTNYYRPST